MRSRIAGMCGASRGTSAITVASTFPTSNPATRTIASARCRRSTLLASFHCGSSGGKCSDDRVQQHVCVAVPGKPDFVRQLDAAENEIAGLVAAVHVVADAYTHGSAGRLLSFGTHRFEVLER